MRFLHTSDWHAGRIWKRVDRLEELRKALFTTVDYVRDHDVDVVLMSGDVFDSRSPSGAAERLVAEIFRAYDRAGAKTVVIAGNHDSPARLEAWRILGELANVTVVPKPRPADEGGVVEVRSRDGRETAKIACVPFASPASFMSAADLVADDSSSYKTYAAAFQGMVESLRGEFGPDTVNILMAHTHLEGAMLSASERTVHVGEQWAAQIQALPHDVHYVALGHIHRPQGIDAACPAYYAGTPMQMDFGEVGEKKTFNVFDARPGGAGATPKRIAYAGARELREIQGTLAEILDAASMYQDAWVRVTVELLEPDPDVARAVREAIPGAVVVNVKLPHKEGTVSKTAGLTHVQMYEAWAQAKHPENKTSLVEAFEELYEQVAGR